MLILGALFLGLIATAIAGLSVTIPTVVGLIMGLGVMFAAVLTATFVIFI